MGSNAAGAESSSSSPINWIYDVFLSFRGEDTRSNFTSHLHMFLRHKGVNVFIDDRIERGEQISEALLKTIQCSLISIVIFSENYASSTWCLDELVEIIECKKSKGQKVLPIFYKVDPSDVRKQNGCYGEGLAKHEANFMEKIPIWRNALTTAANLAGWDLGTIRNEADLIQVIVKEVSSTLNVTTPSDKPLLVGIDSKIESLYWPTEEMYKSECVDMLGIYGIRGIGNTTLAKALYYKMASQFECCCFLSNVREASKQLNGLAQLQKKLLFQILKYDLEDVDDLDRRNNIIKHRLHSKKVLILLDDVDEMKQLKALAGGHDWFGQGSKIIVTTRDKHLLDSHGFGQTYEVEGLWEHNAFELFCWHAFKKSHPSSNYLDLSERATRHCKGHPLALVVLASFLCGRDQAEWSGLLDGFENSLRKGIKDVLQLSFDGLEDEVKKFFLDISCLLVGETVTYVKKMLSEFHSILDFKISNLRHLSLIRMEEYDDDRVQMHDLIKQMGHKIVYDECGDEPGKRSRSGWRRTFWRCLVTIQEAMQ
uniref:TIR domain-containing protein n=1 Tax=Cucumis sativus TaxID=3659 RepID=A0A0A0LII9_CUCSA